MTSDSHLMEYLAVVQQITQQIIFGKRWLRLTLTEIFYLP